MKSWLWIITDVVLRMGPQLVGLVLLLRRPSDRRWWRWGLIAFGLAVLVGVAFIVLGVVLTQQWGSDSTIGASAWVSPAYTVLSVLGLVATCFGVAAVLVDRDTDEERSQLG
ncbi:hypothetical protein BCF74_10638 [Knoellia remsis]|uniref:Uncharacterized protein n=1 Tax=Knoellia remsis TaxID=407159 RepID=A0A2T0UTQ1_9MICO|nr:hypothetical protein [Knoellia remsis]PRY61290.1 hypothetical protein BCF74_10638 [Knoellia remsis]